MTGEPIALGGGPPLSIGRLDLLDKKVSRVSHGPDSRELLMTPRWC